MLLSSNRNESRKYANSLIWHVDFWISICFQENYNVRNKHIIFLVFNKLSLPCSSAYSGRELTPMELLGNSVTPIKNTGMYFFL